LNDIAWRSFSISASLFLDFSCCIPYLLWRIFPYLAYSKHFGIRCLSVPLEASKKENKPEHFDHLALSAEFRDRAGDRMDGMVS